MSEREQESAIQIAAYRYSGPHGAECVVDTQGQHFFGYAAVTLPDSGAEYALSNGAAPVALTRCDAVIDACEGLIAWCSTEKERGSKKHRKQAEEVQNWALDLVSKTRAERAVQPDVDAATGSADDQIPAAAVGAIREALSVLQTSATSPVPQLFPLDRLHESPLNPRQYIPEASIEELASSMRQSGFRAWLPIVARLRSDGDGEIAAGHRRRLAAIRAGLTQVPVLLQEMTDEEFLDILNFDNAGREDVHPLHEAAGWRTWMEKTGKGVLDIAGRIGQSKEYVYQRLKYAALIPDAAAAFLDGKLTSSHAILMARLPEAQQAKELKWCLTPGWRGVLPSSREFAEHLHLETYIDLRDNCPFDRDDAMLLAGAGSCAECPKRAANIPGFEFDPEDPGADLCTDRLCHRQKVDNHVARVRLDLQSKLHAPEGLAAAPVLSISTDYGKAKKGVYKPGEYDKVKQGEKGAKPAVVAQGPDAGKVVYVRLKSSGSQSRRSPEEEKAAREKAEAARQAKVQRELEIRRKILGAVTAKVSGLSRADIEALVLESLGRNCDEICRVHGIAFQQEWQARNKLEAAIPKLSEVELFRIAVEAPVMEHFDQWQVDHPAEKLLALAKRYKVDAAKIRADFEEAAKEAEGGTRKEVIGKLPAVNGKEKAKPAAKKAAPVKKAAAKKAAAKKQAKKGGKK